jgi:hypothetical protein
MYIPYLRSLVPLATHSTSQSESCKLKRMMCKRIDKKISYRIRTAALTTVVHKPSLLPSADWVKFCVL